MKATEEGLLNFTILGQNILFRPDESCMIFFEREEEIQVIWFAIDVDGGIYGYTSEPILAIDSGLWRFKPNTLTKTIYGEASKITFDNDNEYRETLIKVSMNRCRKQLGITL